MSAACASKIERTFSPTRSYIACMSSCSARPRWTSLTTRAPRRVRRSGRGALGLVEQASVLEGDAHVRRDACCSRRSSRPRAARLEGLRGRGRRPLGHRPGSGRRATTRPGRARHRPSGVRASPRPALPRTCRPGAPARGRQAFVRPAPRCMGSRVMPDAARSRTRHWTVSAGLVIHGRRTRVCVGRSSAMRLADELDDAWS